MTIMTRSPAAVTQDDWLGSRVTRSLVDSRVVAPEPFLTSTLVAVL